MDLESLLQALFFSFRGLVVALALLAGPVALAVALGGRRRRLSELCAIEGRLLDLEREQAARPSRPAGVSPDADVAAAAAPAPAPAPVASAAAADVAAEVEPSPAPTATPKRRLDLELLIGGRWLN